MTGSGDYVSLERIPATDPAMIRSVLLAAALLASATTARADCPSRHASYALDWTSNVANERNVSGLPTMAFATSPNGPPLAVRLAFNGPRLGHLFDLPRVEGAGLGRLTIEQRLTRHYHHTLTELVFDRHVSNLSIRIEGLDEQRSLHGAYADRVVLGGYSGTARMTVDPFLTRVGGAGPGEDLARRRHDRQLGGQVPFDVFPVPGTPWSGRRNGAIDAVFGLPVSHVRMTFGSDEEVFEPGVHAAGPGAQAVSLTDVTFCIPFGSRPGD